MVENTFDLEQAISNLMTERAKNLAIAIAVKNNKLNEKYIPSAIKFHESEGNDYLAAELYERTNNFNKATELYANINLFWDAARTAQKGNDTSKAIEYSDKSNMLNGSVLDLIKNHEEKIKHCIKKGWYNKASDLCRLKNDKRADKFAKKAEKQQNNLKKYKDINSIINHFKKEGKLKQAEDLCRGLGLYGSINQIYNEMFKPNILDYKTISGYDMFIKQFCEGVLISGNAGHIVSATDDIKVKIQSCKKNKKYDFVKNLIKKKLVLDKMNKFYKKATKYEDKSFLWKQKADHTYSKPTKWVYNILKNRMFNKSLENYEQTGDYTSASKVCLEHNNTEKATFYKNLAETLKIDLNR